MGRTISVLVGYPSSAAPIGSHVHHSITVDHVSIHQGNCRRPGHRLVDCGVPPLPQGREGPGRERVNPPATSLAIGEKADSIEAAGWVLLLPYPPNGPARTVNQAARLLPLGVEPRLTDHLTGRKGNHEKRERFCLHRQALPASAGDAGTLVPAHSDSFCPILAPRGCQAGPARHALLLFGLVEGEFGRQRGPARRRVARTLPYARG